MVSYDVAIYCIDEGVYKYTNQTTIDENWKPTECTSHTTNDFTIRRINP